MALKNLKSIGSKDVLVVMICFIVVAQLYREGLISEDLYNQVLYTLSTLLIVIRKWMEMKAESVEKALKEEDDDEESSRKD